MTPNLKKLGKDHYSIVGSFSDKKRAERVAKEFKGRGYLYRIIKKTYTMSTYNTPPYKRKENVYAVYVNLSSGRRR